MGIIFVHELIRLCSETGVTRICIVPRSTAAIALGGHASARQTSSLSHRFLYRAVSLRLRLAGVPVRPTPLLNRGDIRFPSFACHDPGPRRQRLESTLRQPDHEFTGQAKFRKHAAAVCQEHSSDIIRLQPVRVETGCSETKRRRQRKGFRLKSYPAEQNPGSLVPGAECLRHEIALDFRQELASSPGYLSIPGAAKATFTRSR